ncbi:hypothetical protein SAMN06265355_12219 [Actinomadura mexicana]|uniref:Phosphotyrosine protein phosphatase I domain-containing protein n=1 Tax=Actinomadura mexicana TaxID=134959 RepID=A0A239FVJ9_9ACTN|nr:hypothetical protein SAMN06265355_12219 [Actinomadura mexicana]
MGAEEGVDIAAETSTVLTADAVRASDAVIIMGCGDARPVFPVRHRLDWRLDRARLIRAGPGAAAVFRSQEETASPGVPGSMRRSGLRSFHARMRGG